MSDEAAVVRGAPAHPLTMGVRVRRAVRTPHAWLQLLRFAVVGGSGYLVNLVVFAAAVHGAGFGYKLSATLAFLVAVSNNFLWNRHWTFRAGHRGARRQAVRFLVVSTGAFLVSLGILTLLIEVWGVRELPAQAIAIVAVTPLSFLVNKLWSFSR